MGVNSIFGGSDASENVVTAIKDRSGKVVGLSAGGSNILQIHLGNTVIPIGDSIMHCASYAGRFSASFVEYAAISSNGAMRLLENKGISGNTSTQLLARLSADALSTSAGWVLVMVGTNDALQDVSLAAYRTNMEAIVSAIVAVGKRAIVVGLPPLNSKNDAAYSRICQEAAYKYSQVYVWPWNPVSSAGSWKSGVGVTFDNVHPTAYGARLAGARLWSQLTNLFHSVEDLAWQDADTSGYVARQSNGLFLADTAGIPTGFTAWASNSAALVNTVEAGTGDVQGNEWVQTYTDAAGIHFFTSTANITLPTGWAIGDRIRIQAHIDVEGFDASGSAEDVNFASQSKLQAYFTVTWSGGSKTYLRSVGSDIAGVHSVDTVLPSNAGAVPTVCAFEMGIEYRNGPGSGVVKWSQINVHNLSLPGRA